MKVWCIGIEIGRPRNRKKGPSEDSCVYGTFYDRDGKIDQWEKEELLNLVIYIRKEHMDPYFEPCTKFNSKWTKDLEVKSKPFRRKHRYISALEWGRIP